MFESLNNKQLLSVVKNIEKERAQMDFTIPLFNYLKEVVEREADVRILIKQPNSMFDAEL